jgi:thymidine phosphorylase
MRVPPQSSLRRTILAPRDGVLLFMDNRRIARLAKLAGAPHAKAAGIDLHVRLGETVTAGAPLCTLHAEAQGEFDYAWAYAQANADMFAIT